jgi:hypothetical protein
MNIDELLLAVHVCACIYSFELFATTNICQCFQLGDTDVLLDDDIVMNLSEVLKRTVANV